MENLIFEQQLHKVNWKVKQFSLVFSRISAEQKRERF